MIIVGQMPRFDDDAASVVSSSAGSVMGEVRDTGLFCGTVEVDPATATASPAKRRGRYQQLSPTKPKRSFKYMYWIS